MDRKAEKLVQRFHDASIKRMAQSNAKEAPTQPLFHYTTEAAFYSILKSKTFWFTSIYFMDDDTELAFGFGVAQSLLAAAFQREDVLTKQFIKPLVDDRDFHRIKERFEFYSASFGQKDDAQQWKDYADGGAGVALGLAPGFFALSNPKDPTPEETTFLGKVIYGEPDVTLRHSSVIDSAISYVKQAYREGLLVKEEDEVEFLKHIAAEMYVEILWNSVTSKANEWGHQKETRLLALNYLPNPKLKIYNAEKRPRVELPQPLLRKSLVEVMLGPKASEDTKQRVELFLREHELKHVPVTAATAQIADEDNSADTTQGTTSQ